MSVAPPGRVHVVLKLVNARVNVVDDVQSGVPTQRSTHFVVLPFSIFAQPIILRFKSGVGTRECVTAFHNGR